MRGGGRIFRSAKFSIVIGVTIVLAGCAGKPRPDDAKLSQPLPAPPSTPIDVTGSAQSAPPAGSAAQLPGVVTGRMGVPDLVGHVLRTNPDVLIAEARIKDQTAGVELAQTAYNPTVEASAGMGPEAVYTLDETGTVANRKEFGFTVRQHLFDFGVISNDVERAARARAAAVDRKAAQSEATVLESVESMLDVMELDELVRIAKGNVEAHQQILALIETNEANGNASVADTKRVTTRLEQAKTSLIDLTTRRSDAEDAFRRLTDLDVRMIDVRPLLKISASIEADPAVLESHPSLRALNEEVASLRAQIDSVRAEHLPTVTLDADARFRDDVGGYSLPGVTAKALVNVQSKIWDGGVSSATEKQLQARIEETLLRLDKQRRELKEQAENAARITATGSEKKAALAERLEASRKVADLQLEQFKDGAVTLFELLDSQAERQKAEAEAVTASFEERRAAIKSLALAGRLASTLTVVSGAPAPQTMAAITP